MKRMSRTSTSRDLINQKFSKTFSLGNSNYPYSPFWRCNLEKINFYSMSTGMFISVIRMSYCMSSLPIRNIKTCCIFLVLKNRDGHIKTSPTHTLFYFMFHVRNINDNSCCDIVYHVNFHIIQNFFLIPLLTPVIRLSNKKESYFTCI